MKTILLLSLVAVGLQSLDGLLDNLNAWVELGIKVAGLAAVMGGAWRWLVGPGFRKVRSVFEWVGAQLELITELRERLGAIEGRLDDGHEHFERLDSAIEALASEEAKAIRRSLRTGDPVEFTESGAVDRRDGDPATDRRT